jgi:hypothetical protein
MEYKNKNKTKVNTDLPDKTKKMPFSNVPIPDVIDLDSKQH